MNLYGIARAYLTRGQSVVLLEDDVPVGYVVGEDLRPGWLVGVDPDTDELVRYRTAEGRAL